MLFLPKMSRAAAISLILALQAEPAHADAPAIEAVEATQSADGSWSFRVTVRHPDTGWDHYADGWAILDPAGDRLGVRDLLHPHETEQPFTRALTGVSIPDDVSEVLVRGRCNTDGWSDGVTRVVLVRR